MNNRQAQVFGNEIGATAEEAASNLAMLYFLAACIGGAFLGHVIEPKKEQKTAVEFGKRGAELMENTGAFGDTVNPG